MDGITHWLHLERYMCIGWKIEGSQILEDNLRKQNDVNSLTNTAATRAPKRSKQAMSY